MSWNDHDHRGEYASDGHDHYDYAREHHRHYGLENDDEKASRRITALQDEVDELRGQLGDAFDRIRALERQTPQARQLQLEADLAAADLTESGYDRHGRGCRCPFCYYDPEDDMDQVGKSEPEEHDSAPEIDDEGGMSGYRYTLPENYQRGQS